MREALRDFTHSVKTMGLAFTLDTTRIYLNSILFLTDNVSDPFSPWNDTQPLERRVQHGVLKGTHSSRRLIRGSYFVLEKKKIRLVN
jgi:hypothetical protein